jgi:hypothetical protein
MRKWGMVVSACYAFILIFFLAPSALPLAGASGSFLSWLPDLYGAWGVWLYVCLLVGCQALLLFLSVDTSRRKLKPRRHIAISVLLASFLSAVLAAAAIVSLRSAASRDRFSLPLFGENVWALIITLWIMWAVIFYLSGRKTDNYVRRFIGFLLRGSVLELLIVVPCHVIVRRRGDCSAPVVTAWGIETGIAIMLLAFGPGVLLLFKKRLESYSDPKQKVNAASSG